MPFLHWTEEYSIGVALFDSEHRRLFDLANDLYDAVLSGQANEELQSIYLRLVSYTNRHFFHEEDFFAASGYQEAEAHRAEHAAMRARVAAFGERLSLAPKEITALEMAQFLKEWINNHILVRDKNYGLFLGEKGVR